MAAQRELEILFPTNYSDSCYQAIPAVAQLAGALRVRITILHAYDARCTTRRQAEEQIHSFFAEAAHYCDCRRVVAEGPALQAITNYATRNRVDLIVAPEADRFGLPRFGHKSLRARLIHSVAAPLWTLGARVQPRGFAAPIRNIACRMAYGPNAMGHIKLASALATRLDAQLHLFDLLPGVDEGTLFEPLYSSRPLHVQAAMDRISHYAEFMQKPPAIHIGPEGGVAGLRRMLQSCDADLLFLGYNQVLRPTLWGHSLERVIHATGCPVIAVDGAAAEFPGWKLSSGARRALTTSLLVPALDRGTELIQPA